MVVCLLAFAVVGLGLIAFGARLGRWGFLVGVVPMGATVVWVLTQLRTIVDGGTVYEQFAWVSGLGLDVDLRLDGLSATMSLIVSVVGVAVLAYSTSYFSPNARDLGRLAGLLVLFGGSMLVLVLADNVLVLYVGWELTSIMSFLLIGNRHEESRARAAALHALLVTTAGGLAMLGGLVVLGQEAGTYRLSEILANPPASSAALTVAIVAILAGAFTKSAQYPFHAWLPGAMAAPTPVSAYLHSATMVKAGIFLVALLAPVFAVMEVWRPLVLTAGCCSLVFGGLRALRQHDLKVLLAFGTVSQLGLLMILFGAGTPATATAGWELLVAHAMFKAALFMVVGIIDHQTGTRDIRQLPPLRAGWRGLEITTLLVLASMAGIPLEMGFVAKELAYESLDGAGFAGHGLVLAVAVGGSMLTVAYAARFYWGAFVRPRRRSPAGTEPSPTPPSIAFVAPAGLFAVASLVLGIFPDVVDGLATASLTGFGAGAPDVHVSLWHGFGLPLLLSALTLAGGALLALGDQRVQPVLAKGRAIPTGGETYLTALRGLGAMSARVTGFVQNGSLPVYAAVILATAAVAPAAVLAGVPWGGWPPFGPIRELPVALILLVAAVGAAVTRRRFSAAVFLGVAGYAMAGLFVVSGAPDLALTQVAVETLTTVVFVLVLRRLPGRFERQSTPLRRAVRLMIAAAVSVAVFVFALVAAGYRVTPPVSDAMVDRSVPEGHGGNVVNVILVDFRGFDTLGEVTVLAAASIGAVALARAGRRSAKARAPRPAAPATTVQRLPFVDVSVRITFYAVLMMSLWLLFVGHNQPGGGFVGGLLAGSAITLRYVAGGISEVRARSRFRPWTVLGAGLLLAAVTATVPLLLGGSVLEVGYATFELPVLGAVPVSSALAFDTGVYLVVVGVVLMAFEAFGDDPAEVTA
jgi:multicomponent Na+:H+ antiporter subunit A